MVMRSSASHSASLAEAVRSVLAGWDYPDECVEPAVAGVVGLVGLRQGAR